MERLWFQMENNLFVISIHFFNFHFIYWVCFVVSVSNTNYWMSCSLLNLKKNDIWYLKLLLWFVNNRNRTNSFQYYLWIFECNLFNTKRWRFLFDIYILQFSTINFSPCFSKRNDRANAHAWQNDEQSEFHFRFDTAVSNSQTNFPRNRRKAVFICQRNRLDLLFEIDFIFSLNARCFIGEIPQCVAHVFQWVGRNRNL